MGRIKYFQRMNQALSKYEWNTYIDKALKDNKTGTLSPTIRELLLSLWIDRKHTLYQNVFEYGGSTRTKGIWKYLEDFHLITVTKSSILQGNIWNPTMYKIKLTNFGLKYDQYMLGTKEPHYIPLTNRARRFVLSCYDSGKSYLTQSGTTRSDIYTPMIKQLLGVGFLRRAHLLRYPQYKIDDPNVVLHIDFNFTALGGKYITTHLVPARKRIINRELRIHSAISVSSFLIMLTSGITYFCTADIMSGSLCIISQLIFLLSLFIASPFHKRQNKNNTIAKLHDTKKDFIWLLAQYNQSPKILNERTATHLRQVLDYQMFS